MSQQTPRIRIQCKAVFEPVRSMTLDFAFSRWLFSFVSFAAEMAVMDVSSCGKKRRGSLDRTLKYTI